MSLPATPTDSAPAERPRRQRVQAASTAMRVLKGLAQLGGRANLTTLARHVGENPAKVHRYLLSLLEEGLVAQDPASSQYHLGAEAIRIGVAAMRQADPIRMAEPALVRLRDTLDMTCFVAVMGNKGPTIVRFEEPGLPVTLNVRVGSVLSLLWSATGRVCLSLLDDPRVHMLAQDELQAASARQRDLLDAADPIGHIQSEVRALGMAIVRDTNLHGISAIAVPVYDFSNHLCAVLTVLGATGPFPAFADSPVARMLLAEAGQISEALGRTETL